MKKQVLISLMVSGMVCAGFVATGFAQDAPTTPVQSNMQAQPEPKIPTRMDARKHGRPKSDHPHRKKMGHKMQATRGKGKRHKRFTESTAGENRTTQVQVNSVNN